ncbi:MAG: phosphoenolpyruvate synthase [Alphaproteobacteria bacterium]|nr:phosphoenolpyruvate synthase [Alphaproteobacteria bacterium]
MRIAIESVLASYPDGNLAHEILIQPMLRDVTRSGVAFSADPSTGSPYAVITIAGGSDTTAVTGGRSNEPQTIICSRDCRSPPDKHVARLLELMTEVEALTAVELVDLEFAFDIEDELYLFQARPLVMKITPPLGAQEHRKTLDRIAAQIKSKSRPHPFLRGRRAIFGVMPDWNPAEMIGLRPRPLALSLYRELITDSIWSYQRHNYGYRNLRGFPLLHDFHGIPYIDVRVSFNSFIPSDVPDELAEKLANYYIDALAKQPALHDKVEFAIIYSCYSLDIQEQSNRLRAAGFSEIEIGTLADSLRRLTNGIINNRKGLWQQDIAKLETLEDRYARICNDIDDPVLRLYWLIEDGKRYGTLPFAGLARAGFIAIQMLRSLVAVGALSEEDFQHFLASLNTVSGELSRDLGAMSREVFLRRYGHLRPGTYDIRSPRYDVEPDLYFNWTQSQPAGHTEPARPFALTLPQMNAINLLLKEHGLEDDVVGLFNFLKSAIEGREKAKFLFTRNVSDALECLASLGARHGLSRDDLSYTTIDAALQLASTCEDSGHVLRQSMREGRERYRMTKAICLPALITQPADAHYVVTHRAEPNFVTQLCVSAPVVQEDAPDAMRGAIVVIPSADPGYDWIFSRGIGGFITAFGGVNSHMAIRAGELRIPAVIGAGESLFRQWAAAKSLNIDCANKRVEILA